MKQNDEKEKLRSQWKNECNCVIQIRSINHNKSQVNKCGGKRMRIITYVSALLFFVIVNNTTSLAKPAGLVGSWRGSGVAKPVDGARERTRCRANVRKVADNSYRATYSCSSSVGLVHQAVQVHKVSANTYSGSFYNPQFKVRGIINISVHGNSQSVSMRSAKGTGYINMRRR